MSLTLGNVTFDCEDTRRMAAFWAEAMGLTVNDSGNDYFQSAGAADGSGPMWFFLKVPEGKTAKNRMHLDLFADDRAAEIARVVALGATHVEDKAEYGSEWSVLRDVEGNEFCIAPRSEPGQ